MQLNKFFDRICYINLSKRLDRRRRMDQVLIDNDISAVRIHATEGNLWGWKSDSYKPPLRGFEGMAGCISTHISILRDAVRDNVQSVLIFEDDCEFVGHFQQKFDDWSENVPSDWDLLYLGGLNGVGEYVNGIDGHVVLVTEMTSTHAYAVNRRVFTEVLAAWFSNFPYLKDSVDGYLRTLQNTLKAYAFNPPMAWQRADHSDIQNGHRDYVDRFKQPLI